MNGTDKDAVRARGRALPLWAAGAAIVLVAINLRAGATSVGPILAELQEGLHMGATQAGVLTALPGLTFAVVGALAVALSRKAGIGWSLALGLAAVSAGLLIRSVVDSAALFMVLTVLAFAGMAVGNILVPAFIKRHGGKRTALLNSVYGTSLALGATLPLLAAGPLAASSPEGWRLSLALWGAVALAAFVPWTYVAVRDRRIRAAARSAAAADDDGALPVPPSARHRISSSKTAVALCIYFGVQSMHAYVQFGWAAQIYRDAGLSQSDAGLMAAIIASLGIAGGMVMPLLVARSPRLRTYIVLLAGFMFTGYLGLLLAPTDVPWLWAVLLGLGGFAFPTALALIIARSRDPQITAELSGFCQPVGYLLAALGPFAIGALHEATGSWTAPISILMGSAVLLAAAGVMAAAPKFVDDELAGSAKVRT